MEARLVRRSRKAPKQPAGSIDTLFFGGSYRADFYVESCWCHVWELACKRESRHVDERICESKI